jgi:opacity protein-like surface antigen
MHRRVTSALAAAALVLGAVAAEAQQTTSSQRIPVRKDTYGRTTTESGGQVANEQARLDSIRADSIAAAERARQDSLMALERARQDSLAAIERARQDSIAAVERARQDSIARAEEARRQEELRRQEMMARWGNGLYFGIGGGTQFLQGYLDDVFSKGFNATGFVGWQPLGSPLGLRFDLTYDQLRGTDIDTEGGEVNVDDMRLISGLAEATMRFGSPMSAVRPYLIGGGGVHHFQNYDVSGGSGGASDDASSTRAGVNGGLGLQFMIGRANMFVESRYMHVFTKEEASKFIPVIVGFNFF